MGTTDHRVPPDESMLHRGPPDLVRVGQRGADGGRRSPWSSRAGPSSSPSRSWKPWESGAESGRGTLAVPPGTAGAPPSGDHLPDRQRGTADARGHADVDPQTFAGLDLSLMGTVDPHNAWGVAVGYVSQEPVRVRGPAGASRPSSPSSAGSSSSRAKPPRDPSSTTRASRASRSPPRGRPSRAPCSPLRCDSFGSGMSTGVR